MDKNITCFVLGGSTNALGQIRAIHQLGYKCINLVEKGLHAWSLKSKYCEGHIAPHPFNEREKCVQYVVELLKKESQQCFIFFASDDWMDMVGDNEKKFKTLAEIPQSAWPEMSKLYNKKYLYRIAEENGIPYPKTVEVESLKELKDKMEGMVSPYIVKPQTTVSQNLLAQNGIHAYHRTQKFETKEDLINWVELLLSKNIDIPVLVQEFIPGDATSLYTLTSYSDKEGSLIAGSVGHKLRQFPPEAGRITSGVLKHDNNLFETGKQFLKCIKYHGLANTEFKFDQRDGKFKLMEINTRLGAWNYSTLYSGLNLIDVAINNTLGIKYEGVVYTDKSDGKIWYNELLDLGAAVYLNRKVDGGKHKMSIGEWRRTLKGKSFKAVWDWKDPLPFFFYGLYLLKGLL